MRILTPALSKVHQAEKRDVEYRFALIRRHKKKIGGGGENRTMRLTGLWG